MMMSRCFTWSTKVVICQSRV